MPIVTMTYGAEDNIDRKVTVALADGRNGEYTIVEDGELPVGFEP